MDLVLLIFKGAHDNVFCDAVAGGQEGIGHVDCLPHIGAIASMHPKGMWQIACQKEAPFIGGDVGEVGRLVWVVVEVEFMPVPQHATSMQFDYESRFRLV